MTSGAKLRIAGAAVALVVAAAGLAFLIGDGDRSIEGPTVGEKLAVLKAERASLQARADGETRVGLVGAFRTAALLGDALAARGEADRERGYDDLSPQRRQAFAELDALHGALKDALGRPGAGARQMVRSAAQRAQAALDRLAGHDDLPLVLQFTPRFVPPRRATAELTLAPDGRNAPPQAATVRLGTVTGKTPEPPAPSVADSPVSIEIVGLHLASSGGPLPVLAIGNWRGEASVAPERLRFSVPRQALATDATRTRFAAGSLAIRRGARTITFELLFVVLPDLPGSFALDQKVSDTAIESKTLLSPEILARGGVGETRTVRRCFDPPAGWRFDKARRRILVVERLAWQDDVPDATLNAGTVEFASDERPAQICIVVTARPALKAARAATIGRFEATLVRERAEDRVVRSGIRALDWQEAVRLPIEAQSTTWKLYLRLFDEVDRELEGGVTETIPFVQVTLEDDGKMLVLKADPAAEP